MRRTLFFIFLMATEIVAAQTARQPIVSRQIPGLGFQFVYAKTQTPVNSLIWDEAEAFVNGYSRVLLHNQFSFVDLSGKPISSLTFDAARNYSHKLAAVRKESGWGFINESGKVVIPLQYEIVFDFKEPVTAVFANKKWQLINVKGELIKTLDITVFYGFKNGIAKIDKEGIPGTMNTKGEIILSTPNFKNPTNSRFPNIPTPNNAVNNCPDNIDFEYGSFFNWKCFIGKVDSVGNTNVITVNPSPPTANRHTIYSRVIPSLLDPFGLFPRNPPDGSNFAVRLGNTNIGAQAERIQYAIHVPLNDSNFSIKYDYAVVFEDPGHTSWTQPRFTARLFDSAANTYVSCASFEYISTSGLPGFQRSTVDTSVMFKPWSTVFVSLRAYAGRTIFLEFTTADCVRRGHWGYAYVDVEKLCGQPVQMQYECNAPHITTLDGPPGFQTYNWWDSTFSTQYGSGQQIVLNPGPAINTTIWLEMIPFSDFGCRDTIPVYINGVFNANFSLSDTVGICAPHTFTFYNSDIPSTSAIWDFGDGSTATGDTVTHTYLVPGNFNVSLNVILPGGCVGSIIKNVSVLQPVGSFYFNGEYFCNSQQVQFDAVVNSADSLFWDFGDGIHLATTQTTVYHVYALPGVYMPYLTAQSAFGCQNTVAAPDTMRIEKLRAGFFESIQKNCGSSVLSLTDTSYSYFGINSYHWNFGDGNTGNGNTISHTYTTTGTYNIQLIITGISGCLDTITKPIFIKVNNLPVAAITGINTQCPSVPVTFNSVLTSADAINYIHWTSSNGNSGSGNNFTVNFALPGSYTIQLIAGTVNGCFDTTTHSIIINPTPDVIQPGNQSLCNGVNTAAISFTGAIVGTAFSWTNNNASIGLAAAGSGSIPSFTAINNTANPITATIIVSPLANSCPGSSKTFTITVNPTPAVNQPSDQVLCKNIPTAAISFNGAVTGTSYTWTNNNTAIGLAASGSGNIPSFTTINNTNLPISASITVTPNANGCTGLAKIFTITVNPIPAITQPVNNIYCNGAVVPAISFASSVTGSTINWTNDQPTIGIAASGTNGITAFTATNNTNAPITATISVNATASGCTGPTKTFTITVNPTPNIAQPINQVLCNGSVINISNFTGTVAGTSFNWTNNNTAIGLAASGAGNINAFTAVNNSTIPVIATVTVTTTANGCPGQTKSFTITVNPTANVAQPINQNLCNGTAVTAVNFTGSVIGTSYNWVNNNPAIGLGSTGSGNIPSFIATNTTNAPVSATITVSPTAGSCAGPIKTFTIIVKPTPDVAQPNNQTLCKGSSSAAILFSSAVTGTSYTWSNSNTTIGLPATGIGNIPAFLLVNNSDTFATAIITVNPMANACAGPSKNFTIIVKPASRLVQNPDQALCNGFATSIITFAATQTGSTFSWTNNNPSIGLASTGIGDITSFNAINTSTATSTAIISTIATANGCTGPVSTFKILVHPTPKVVATNNRNVCLGTIAQLSATGASQYSWSPIDMLSCSNCANPISTPTDTIRYIVTGTNVNGCTNKDTVDLTVIKPFQMLVSPNDTLCIGSSVNLKALQANTYLWSPAAGLNRTDIAEPIATPSVSTNYRVIGYDAYHCFKDTGYVFITVGQKPTVNVGADITTQTGNSITLHPVIQNGPIVNYSWTPATGLSCDTCATPVVMIRDNISYSLTVKNKYGCTATDLLNINVFCKSAQVFIPNAFTPDGNGLNEILMVRGQGIFVKSFRIFNRWGELVFEKTNFSPNDKRYGWDGKIRGVTASPDVFVYTAEVICDNGILYTYKGNTTVLK
jgi:hypothetical protein